MKTIQVRISDEDKKQAEQVLEAIGLDLPTAIRAFLKQVQYRQAMPFELTMKPELDENGFTPEEVRQILQSEKDAEKGINVSPTFDNIEEALAYLDNPSEEYEN